MIDLLRLGDKFSFLDGHLLSPRQMGGECRKSIGNNQCVTCKQIN